MDKLPLRLTAREAGLRRVCRTIHVDFGDSPVFWADVAVKLPNLRKIVRTRYRSFAAPIWRRQLAGTAVVGITGSAGKSSTAYILGQLLSQKFKGNCSFGPNSDGSIEKPLLETPRNADYFVKEVSAEKPGALDRRLELLRPRIGVVTTIGLDHYRSYRTREAVAEEKSKLVKCLPSSGTAILNADDPYVAAMADDTGARVIKFGTGEDADVRASEVSCVLPERLSLVISYQGESFRVQTQFIGEHLAVATLAAVSAALAIGVPLRQCCEKLSEVRPLFMRMSAHRHPSGALLILDTAKAPFWSLRTSFSILSGARTARRTIVLGRISDTSGGASANYRKAGRAALEYADRVVLVGPAALSGRKLKETADGNRIELVPTFVDLVAWLDANLIEDEIVLVKSGKLQHLERLALLPTYGSFCEMHECGRDNTCMRCRITHNIFGRHFQLPDAHVIG